MPPLDPRYADSNEDDMRAQPKSRDWGVPPFEPLNIRTAEFDQVPVLAGPILINAEPAPFSDPDPKSLPIMASAPTLTPTPSPAPSPAPAPAAAGLAPRNAAEEQKIVTIRVCAVGEARWSGAQLMAALGRHGLAFGRYQVFHRKHADGRSLFCVASLVEPGTFDIAAMADQEFRGVTLFAVMPGPTAPLETLDELVTTARGLAEDLSGMVQDSKGMPLSPQRAAALAAEIAHFQASLPAN